ncbi:MAG: glucose-6-phosphate dehydrogenase [Planctomycetota bacterium]
MAFSPSLKAEPCVVVIFGASGDLTGRKLIPALFELFRRGDLPKDVRVLGVSRTPMSDDDFRERLRPMSAEHASGFDPERWRAFSERVHYEPGDATDSASFERLAARIRHLGELDGLARTGGAPNTLFYLSVAPGLYEPIIEQLGAAGLVTEGKRWCSLEPQHTAWQRVIVEKPFGTDLESAASLNRALGRVFEEEAVFRIDHYLGKELVQNISVLRFANSIFEPVWNGRYIDHVQVTAAESLGVGSRAGTFYDSAGAVRDMIQSHLLQVLSLVAIEPPSSVTADALMREKIKLINSARLAETEEAVLASAVLGRYGAGGGEPAYEDLEGVDPARRTETYGALRVEFDNWRWAGVPFFLRSGKRLAAKSSEVVVRFKQPPVDVFRLSAGALPPDAAEGANELVISFAPKDRLSLTIRGKVPGPGLRIASAELDLDYQEEFGGEPIEAYGPLLLDAMRGDRTLFRHRDEVEGGWRIVDPILSSEALRSRIETYAPGSWGPAGADGLLGEGGRRWHVPSLGS